MGKTIGEWLAFDNETANKARMRRLQRAAKRIGAGRVVSGPIRIMDRANWLAVKRLAGDGRS